MNAVDSIRPFLHDLSQSALLQVWLGPAIAFLIAVVGRVLLRGPLAPAGTALALVCGWLPLFGPLRAVAKIWAPHVPAEALMLATLAATAVLMMLENAIRQQATLLLAIMAVAAAWWLSGAHNLSAVLADQVVRIGFLAILLWAGMRVLMNAAPWPALVAALSLGLALLAAGEGGVWPMLGFVVAAAIAAQLPGTPASGALVPAGLGLGGVAGLAVLVTGRLPHGGLGAADVAGAAPLMVLWLPGPLRRLGQHVGPPAAGLLMVLASFVARRIMGG